MLHLKYHLVATLQFKVDILKSRMSEKRNITEKSYVVSASNIDNELPATNNSQRNTRRFKNLSTLPCTNMRDSTAKDPITLTSTSSSNLTAQAITTTLTKLLTIKPSKCFINVCPKL